MISRELPLGAGAIGSAWNRWADGRRFPSWPVALIGIVAIKAALLLALNPGSFLLSYSGISYLCLLVLAAVLAIRNGLQNKLGSRMFWSFLAAGYGLWALHQAINIYYELGLHVEAPQTSIADPLLFLHLVPFAAALITLPHRNASDRRPHRAILDSVIVLCFWSFLYGYFVFPSQYLAGPGNYGLRFVVLYLLQGLGLVLAAGFLTLRAQAPWRSIYLHLFCASTLYLLSSTAANIAIDSGGYVNGKLYGLGLTASVCWFVWIPLRAQQLSESAAGAKESDGSPRTSAWVMLAVIAISIPMAWELLHREEAVLVQTFRMVIALVAILCLACTAYIKEHLAKLELLSRVGLADGRLRLAMESGKSVGWDWDIKSGRDSWFGDLNSMFGIPSYTYTGRVEDFHRRVHPDDRERVAKAVKEAMVGRRLYEAEFRVLRADSSVRWVAARGTFYYASNGDPERMLGVAVDITDRKQAEETLRESEERLLLAAQAGRMYAYEWDVATDLVVRSPEFVNTLGLSEPIQLTHEQLLERIHPDDRPKCIAAIRKLTPGNPVTRCTYRLLLPSGVTTWLENNARAHFNEQGQMLRMIGMVADVSERKRAEEMLSSLSQKLIEAQERERIRIARELHDDINQRMALLAVNLHVLSQKPPASAAELRRSISKESEMVTELVRDVEALSHRLHSSKLEYLGLAVAGASFCQKLSEHQKVKIDFHSDGIPRDLPQEVSLCLFRIMQEALQNGIKHSGAQRFEVHLSRERNTIRLSVRDSGIGFDLDAAIKGRGVGLSSMQERAKLIGGELLIESRPQHGTTIQVRAPLRPTVESGGASADLVGRYPAKASPSDGSKAV
jgi:PAS domain S-box-containing protein